ncbi:Protein suppressor of white apricot like protein [Argiope bruennichi]|uniref:Protein suppressor of white apricot like protein n=1 Tax=Argiope bruennichi TaxID=94029 RepID=A0A8T0EM40_ARGBR|nr:Protein suppressor of white apricot like protein [Argiope bruennichi]
MPIPEHYQQRHYFKTPEPCFRPGYTGFLPEYGPRRLYQFGETYGHMTHKLMKSHPVAGLRMGNIVDFRKELQEHLEEELEEELKRLRAAIAGDGAYHEIAFSYDSAEAEQSAEPEAVKVEEPEDVLYQVPEGLSIPKGMEVPYTMKIHAIIEKTALFVSEQGGQMEIIIKMKQQGNPQFAFMHLDNPLYPYYKHLVNVIKSGTYKPAPARKVSRSEDEDDDGHYLHPSLMSGRQEPVPKFTVPTINFRRSYDDSYSVLVRNLQQHRKEEAASPAPELEQNSNEGSENTSSTSDEENNELKNSEPSFVPQIIPPPPDIQPIIDKMAEYVGKNGEDFETIVKSKNDKRFDFLHSWHEYHNYYIYKRNLIKTTVKSQSSPVSENATNDGKIQNIPYQCQPKPIVQESGPVLYKNGQAINKQPKQSTKPNEPTNVAIVPAKVEHDAFHSQDSQNTVLEPQSKSIEGPKDDTSNSMDFSDSPKIDKSSEEEPKTKPPKALKGPISFSLKSKETDTPNEKAKLTPLLMDDSEDESSEENKTEKDTSVKRRKSVDDSNQVNITKTTSTDLEVKTPKQNSEILEAKQAEERIKDKLVSAARERLAQQRKEKQMQLEQQKREEQLKKEKQQMLDQQRKEKQLQVERRRKAELFLKMLKKKNPDSTAVVSHILASDKASSSSKPSDFWSLPDTSTIAPPTDGGILFHGSKVLLTSTGVSTLKSECSSDTVSEHSGEEEPISVIGEKLSSEEPEAPPEETVVPKPEKKKKKRKHSSRSRSREHSRSKRSKTPRRSKEKKRSRSHSRKQEKKKEKQLPAAYALSARSRSRSRSPRRYRPSFNHWNRRR